RGPRGCSEAWAARRRVARGRPSEAQVQGAASVCLHDEALTIHVNNRSDGRSLRELRRALLVVEDEGNLAIARRVLDNDLLPWDRSARELLYAPRLNPRRHKDAAPVAH